MSRRPKAANRRPSDPDGGGGIRTLGTTKPYNGFRDRPVQPLRHPSRAKRSMKPSDGRGRRTAGARRPRREDAGDDLGAMVEARIGEDVQDASRRPRLRVGGRVDHARDPREDDRPRAHRARLQRHVERALQHPPGAKRGGGLAQRQHLGVRGRVLAQLALVAAAPDHATVVVHDDGPDRDVVMRHRRARLLQGDAHPALVMPPCCPSTRHHGGTSPLREGSFSSLCPSCPFAPSPAALPGSRSS